MALLLACLVALALAVTAGILVVARRRRARRRDLARRAPRHPIVLVHGFGGFDELAVFGRRHAYFRGIVHRLEALGATVYRPRLPALASVPERAARLAEFIRGLPAARVNVIAHSMGGLDARWAIAKLGAGDRIAALVTVGTPHRGTPLADLADLRPAVVLRRVADKLGLDLDGLDWLSAARMDAFNVDVADDPQVVYASVVCRAGGALWWKNPLLAPIHGWVKRRAGTNDGVVPAASQRWGHTLAELEVDHWGQVGWSTGADAALMYEMIARELAGRGL